MKNIVIIGALVLLFLFGLWQQFYTFTPLDSPQEVEYKVQIEGEVNQPGVYEMEEGDRLDDLIQKAGGLTQLAEKSRINLAQKLVDGEKIEIPKIISETSEEQKDVKTITVHSLSKSQWEEISGIGDKLSDRILEFLNSNPKATIEDLDKVPGLGIKVLAAIREYFSQLQPH